MKDATSHYPKEITKRLRNKILSPKTRMGKLTSPICAALMMKAEMVRAQRLTMTSTVKFHLKTMPTKRLIAHYRRRRLD